MDKPHGLDRFAPERFELGPFGTNLYLLAGPGQTCTLVDAGYDVEVVLDEIRQRGLSLERVVLTHAHIDHIAGLPAVRRAWPDVPILIHPDEAMFLADPGLNLSAYMGEPFAAPDATGFLEHGDTLEMGASPHGDALRWEVRHTPGHSPGGISLVQPEIRTAIVGDTLFTGSIGRTDFPTADHATLLQSIRDQLFTLPDDTTAWPGHGPDTEVGTERSSNPFLQD